MEHKEHILALIKNCKSDDISHLLDDIIEFNIEHKQKEDDIVFGEKRNIMMKDIVKEVRSNSGTRSKIRKMLLYKYRDINSWYKSDINEYKILLSGGDERVSDLWNKFCINKDCYYKDSPFVPHGYHEYYRFILDTNHMLCDECIDDIDDFDKSIVKPELIDEIMMLIL